MDKSLTVGDLRKALEGVPDELEVHFSSDTEEAYEIILTMARRVKYRRPLEQMLDCLDTSDIDYFDIYGNAADEEDYENDNQLS